MRLLPRQHHVHYAGELRDGDRHAPEVGDDVYLNDGGRLFSVTLLACDEDRCLGVVNGGVYCGYSAGSLIEFGEDAIYVVKKKH
jgi:hypothetical protein